MGVYESSVRLYLASILLLPEFLQGPGLKLLTVAVILIARSRVSLFPPLPFPPLPFFLPPPSLPLPRPLLPFPRQQEKSRRILSWVAMVFQTLTVSEGHFHLGPDGGSI